MFAKPKRERGVGADYEGGRGSRPNGPAIMPISPQRMAAHGYPMSHIGTRLRPTICIADYFRGATGTMKDLYRKKDKLLPLLDKAGDVPDAADDCLVEGRSGTRSCSIPIHWAPDNFMSQEQFKTSGGRRSAR